MKIAIIGSRNVVPKEIENYIHDGVIAFWDGTSKGTRSVIEYAKKTGKPCRIILCSTE